MWCGREAQTHRLVKGKSSAYQVTINYCEFPFLAVADSPEGPHSAPLQPSEGLSQDRRAVCELESV